ncbi:alpha/beta fold hydrolase [Acinetobacter brisouii]|uniref:alpha/beta fold hydrolase n=1 Tax=Acinetobacter brisouii TaxID=396323 RepID=UPI0035AE37E1
MNQNIVFSPSPYSKYMREAQVDLGNGIQLHIEMGGNPEHPCVLLIMGLGGQLILWPDFFCKSLIDQGFCVIRFDNRDIGLSSKITTEPQNSHHLLSMMARFSVGLKNHGAPYTLEDMADDVGLLLDKLEISQCNLIGASMGGMIAQIVAAKYPEKISKLGLLFTSNNQPLLPAPGIKQLKLMISKRPTQEDEIIRQNVQLYKIIGSPNYINVEEIRLFARKAYFRSYYPNGVLHQLLAILCTGSLLKWDQQIQQPTLVVHGASDRLLPPKHGRVVAKAIKAAKFELIAGMGHDIPPHFIPQLSGLFAHHFKP